MKWWEIIADNLKRAGLSVGWVPSMEPFTAALLVTSRVPPQSAAEIFRPKVYYRVLVVFLSFLTIVALATVNLPDIATAAEPSKTEAAMEDRVKALIPEIEAYMASGMKGFDVPGLAFGIVVGDKLVYAKGFGVRSKGGGVPVDTRTVFQIGSNDEGISRHDPGHHGRSRQVAVGRPRCRSRAGVPVKGSLGHARVPRLRPAGSALRASPLRQRLLLACSTSTRRR